MKICAVCGHGVTEACHVRDKASFPPGVGHDFHNIVLLCATHHSFFDTSRLAIDPGTRCLLLLHCITWRRVAEYRPLSAITIRPEYIEWKNERVHTYLKAELRRKRRLLNS